jgi:NAD(P)-dependent dehydrogenase (short-subunit alcohol dehydrogenase family)
MRAKSADSAFQLDGKIALVTGAGRGIGRAVALALAAAELVLVSRTQGELDEVAAEIVSGAVMPAAAARCHPLRCGP